MVLSRLILRQKKEGKRASGINPEVTRLDLTPEELIEQ